MERRCTLALVVAMGELAACFANAQVSDGAGARAFESAVAPVLAKQCGQCHGAKTQMAALDFSVFRDGKSAADRPELWRKVRQRVQGKTMPPPPLPALKESEAAVLLRWIESVAPEATAGTAGPGRVTARRLNRAEFNNTIRDFLGVTTKPAEDFPLDNQGYGYDNNGDVLTLSPMLMEKYMAAARSVSRVAVYGEPYEKKPGIVAKLMIKSVQDDGRVSGNVLPFSLRGSLDATFRAPVEADYLLQFRSLNRRGRAPGVGRRGRPLTEDERKAMLEASRSAAPPVEFRVEVDGELVKKDVVVGEEAFDYTRGPTTVKVHMKAGEHRIHFYIPDHANLDEPRSNINPDGRRRLGAEWMEILGPYDPVGAKPASYSRIFFCPEQDAGCTQRIVTSLARRGFRRPPTEAEVAGLLKLVAMVRRQGDSFEEGIRVALQSILVSPSFLFRIERDPEGGSGTYRVNDYELASRLSYFLWSSMPDDELLRLAGERKLSDRTVLQAQVRRMLRDSRASSLVDGFAVQWLDLRAMERKKPDAAMFPDVDDELLAAMRKETLLFTSEIFREDRNLLDMIDGKFTYVNGPLARYYGIKGVDGFEFRRVGLEGTERGGIVTQGAVLALTSYATRTSPVIRGKWVLQTLLGAAPPPPPGDVPALDEEKLGTEVSVRARLEQHRANPSCAACHNAMDPIGFGLENFDAAGGWRTHEGKLAVDASGVLPDGQRFQGVSGLRNILRAQGAMFTRNLSEQMLTFALGRGVEASDKANVDRINERVMAGGNKMSELVLAIVESEPFQMRTKEANRHASR
jgi:mono/diheme cytochrome c family protein